MEVDLGFVEILVSFTLLAKTKIGFNNSEDSVKNFCQQSLLFLSVTGHLWEHWVWIKSFCSISTIVSLSPPSQIAALWKVYLHIDFLSEVVDCPVLCTLSRSRALEQFSSVWFPNLSKLLLCVWEGSGFALPFSSWFLRCPKTSVVYLVFPGEKL